MRQFKKGDKVTVIELNNYRVCESVPFSAIFERYISDDDPYEDFCFWVKSDVTGKSYEIYGPMVEEYNEHFIDLDKSKLIFFNTETGEYKDNEGNKV